ncbi:MAG TPA: succinylglutamate desuccinylase/aspartoacylase family protein [Stellaceae bacterium]|nr:succinylglutamate desuccinylase/aspartoacylase family protein [Stellaceae bacterium]
MSIPIRSLDPAPLTVGQIPVAPGSRARTQLDLIELADGAKVRLPVVAINGARPGPRLYLGAAIHGDEVNGVAILAEALAGVDLARLSGSILCVPVQHPLAFHADHRIPLSQFMKSPLDQAPIDAWTCFPGNPAGNLAETVAATLFGLIRQCSCAIDIHTPTRGGRYVPIAILPSLALGAAAEASLWLAEQFAAGYIMKTDTGMYVGDGILCIEATKADVPAFTCEIGEGGRLERAMIDEGVRCVRNALVGLGMIEGEIRPPAANHVMRAFLGIRARRGGLLHTAAELGTAVAQGDVLARIVDIFGDTIETVRAPASGIFVRATTLSTVSTGERVATLGLF